MSVAKLWFCINTDIRQSTEQIGDLDCRTKRKRRDGEYATTEDRQYDYTHYHRHKSVIYLETIEIFNRDDEYRQLVG